MKRIILIAILALAAGFSANAQYAQKQSYKELKEIYNFRVYHEHESDPYNTSMAGLFGFFAPGVPQLVMNETLRGACFFGGYAVCYFLIDNSGQELSKLIAYDSSQQPYYTDPDKAAKYTKIIIGSAIVDLGIMIWSCIDAKRVAKVKNMYYQDVYGRQSSVKMNVEPFLSYTPAEVSGNVQPAAGLSMKLSF